MGRSEWPASASVSSSCVMGAAQAQGQRVGHVEAGMETFEKMRHLGMADIHRTVVQAAVRSFAGVYTVNFYRWYSCTSTSNDARLEGDVHTHYIHT